MSNIIDTPLKYENDFIIYVCNEEKHYVSEIWKDYGEDEPLKVAKIKALEMFEKYQTKGYIADMLKFKGASPDIFEWINTFWLPKMSELGIKYIAMVFPEDMFATFSLEQVLGTAYSLVTAEKFKTSEEAVSWMEKQTAK